MYYHFVDVGVLAIIGMEIKLKFKAISRHDTAVADTLGKKSFD
jgi:hypothetical protein